MQKKLTNQLIIMTDEHTRKVLMLRQYNCENPKFRPVGKKRYRLLNAYCNVPICVPSRASFATGQYAHTSGHWDNATPYTGKPESWGHALQRSGIQVGSIGKLHYRNSKMQLVLIFRPCQCMWSMELAMFLVVLENLCHEDGKHYLWLRT